MVKCICKHVVGSHHKSGGEITYCLHPDCDCKQFTDDGKPSKVIKHVCSICKAEVDLPIVIKKGGIIYCPSCYYKSKPPEKLPQCTKCEMVKPMPCVSFKDGSFYCIVCYIEEFREGD